MKIRFASSLLPVAVIVFAVAFMAGDALAQCGTATGSGCGQEKASGCGGCSEKGKTCGTEGKSCGSSCGSEKGNICCPFSQCLVSGKKLAEVKNPVVYNHEGRNIYFADAACFDKFKANKDGYIKKFDLAMKKVQASFYPLDRCVVTGDKFSDDKKPVDYLYKDRLVRFCCPSLIAQFNENPAKYLAKLDAAVITQQKGKYPLQTCIVSNTKLDKMGGPYNHIYGNQLVRFCCKGCVPAFNKNPGKYMVKLYKAWTDAKPKSPAAAVAAPEAKKLDSGRKLPPKKTAPVSKPKPAKKGC